MTGLSKRAFLGVSAGGLSALFREDAASAALQCAAIGLPHRLNVDCSSGRNLKLFLQNQEIYGLAGVVSMMSVAGESASYAYGTMFLFPFLKRRIPHEMLPALKAFLPDSSTTTPLRFVGLPPDEQFCRYELRAPWQSFIGFSVDKPVDASKAKQPWYTNVDQIGNGAVGIEWTSQNLNHPWFAGSRWIPAGKECNGMYWRALIIRAVRDASLMAC
jgi:hypothetical protein